MDNITHSLIGLSVGEILHRASHKHAAKPLPRGAILATSVLGNNFPDLDICLNFFLQHKLDYMLHHRGHTHTLLFCLPQALLIVALITAWFRCSGNEKFSFTQVTTLAAIALFGCCLHIFADSWNSYGVHPFWPWNNNWYYGDSVFIVEPWLWALALPPLFFLARGHRAKLFYAVVSLFMFGLAKYTGFVPWPLQCGLGLILGLGYLLAWRWPFKILLTNMMLVCFLLLALNATSQKVRAALQTLSAAEATVDLALTPFPANPFCWNVVRVAWDQKTYTADLGVFAPFPGITKVESCPAWRDTVGTAALQPLSSTDSQLVWIGRYSASAEEWQGIQNNCWGQAFLRFSRVPFFAQVAGQVIVGDLRFDREPGLGFSEFALPTSAEGCPSFLPPWPPPRPELLPLAEQTKVSRTSP